MTEIKSGLVTLPELARRWRVPVAWLRREADEGRLPHVRAGSQRLFDAATVERLLADRATGAKVAPGEVRDAS